MGRDDLRRGEAQGCPRLWLYNGLFEAASSGPEDVSSPAAIRNRPPATAAQLVMRRPITVDYPAEDYKANPIDKAMSHSGLIGH